MLKEDVTSVKIIGFLDGSVTVETTSNNFRFAACRSTVWYAVNSSELKQASYKKYFNTGW